MIWIAIDCSVSEELRVESDYAMAGGVAIVVGGDVGSREIDLKPAFRRVLVN